MKITNIKAQLTGEDVLSILKEYVKVEDLTFERVELKELVVLHGSYKKGVKVPFSMELGLGNVHDNSINIIITDINVAKIGIIKGLKNLIIKKILEAFPLEGISYNNDTIAVNTRIITRYIPYVNFDLKSVKLKENLLEVELTELTYSDTKKAEEAFSKKKNNDKHIVKKNDDYTKLRKIVKRNIPDKYIGALEYALLIPDIIALFVRLIKDKRVNKSTKAIMASVVLYIFSPLDAVINLIPFVGEIDDIVAIFFTLNKVINDIPENVILENWQGKDNILLIARKGISFINNTLGAENISRIVKGLKKKTISVRSKDDV